MALLPETIIPQSEPIGRVNADGSVTISKNWWLLLYNIVQNSIGPANAVSDQFLELLQSGDDDVIDSDSIALRKPVSNLNIRATDPPDIVPTVYELPDISRSLLLAQDPLLPDPPALAQPVASVSLTGSPFTYTALSAGFFSITGGTVSSLAISRQGTSVTTGLTTGLVPLARYDQLIVTYTGSPTANFLPWSSQ